MTKDSVIINRISKPTISNPLKNYLHICWIQKEIDDITINGQAYPNISNAIFFLNSHLNWTIEKGPGQESAGYIMSLKKDVLNNPVLSKLQINEISVFNSGEIPIINLSPGIAKRTQSILEMIDELLGSELHHKDEAIMSLLNTFFVYCDGQCNIKSMISNAGSKNAIVYNFKKLVDQKLTEHHDVADYAVMLNITPKYLNECVKEVLGFTAKGIIAEQLLMRSRHLLKFSDKSIKEISYNLGFSSPDYFSYFFKNYTGSTPSSLRKI